MAHLYRRGDVFWVKWHDPPGVQHFKSLRTREKREAKALVSEIEAKLARGHHVIPGNRPFKDVLDEWLKDKRARREEGTVKTYEKYAEHFKRLFPLTLRIGTVEAEHVADYLEKRRADGVGPLTLNHERIALSMVFNWAIKRDYAEKNPAAKVEPYSVRPKQRQEVGEAEFAAVRADLDREIAAATGESRYRLVLLRDVVTTIWWSGLRIGEIARLRPEDVNLEREEYAVRSAANKGPRLEPMHPEVKAIFERRMKFAKNRIFGTADNQDAYNSVKLAWSTFAYRHPKHKGRSFHALRHAFNTRMHDVIDNPLIAMRAMGHKTIQMSSHYTHVGVEKVREALKRLV